MNTQDYNTLTEVIESMIDEGEKPIKAIAAEIGKPYPTLKRELNPADDGAKLGADALLGIMAGGQARLCREAQGMGRARQADLGRRIRGRYHMLREDGHAHAGKSASVHRLQGCGRMEGRDRPDEHSV